MFMYNFLLLTTRLNCSKWCNTHEGVSYSYFQTKYAHINAVFRIKPFPKGVQQLGFPRGQNRYLSKSSDKNFSSKREGATDFD